MGIQVHNVGRIEHFLPLIRDIRKDAVNIMLWKIDALIYCKLGVLSVLHKCD